MRETESFNGTRVQNIVEGLNQIYGEIEAKQAEWKSRSPFQCPDGCGSCCVDFEPDVLESEALYLAAWMLHHQFDRANSILENSFVPPRAGSEVEHSSGCFLFDPSSPWHCTVYGGRCLICRLFGYSGDRGKDGRPRWKPCKFLPLESSSARECARHQYDEGELLDRFGIVPPIMGDIAAQVLALTPDSVEDRKPLRVALPQAIAKIKMLQRFSNIPPEPNAPEPNPESPLPLAS
jgi:uncharacterized protein